MSTAPALQPALMTAEQLVELPDAGKRHELVEGVLLSMAPAGGRHGSTGARLLIRVGTFVEDRDLGDVFTAETGFLLRRDPDTVRAPDVAFIASDRVAEARVPGFIPLAPDLVAEVVSPSDRATDVTAKALAWLDAGVRLVWVVDPETRTVTVYRPDGVRVLRGADALDGGDVLPGFTLPLTGLWG
ncbi:Uma2 family endonuclease [Geodermatophilus sp. DSM 44513]|uniref:Uma2 family endonuclease n=1 Tax=Geodermatophilus sp. DSM 44513 TaxID=1528104 RepID=UPI00126C5016|nr:Uma2 family endonuclease [Geodermatophilus sp. DSM 44513]WNV76589.1 Uma2 family endonuclease [Geodermatophilus sp. DSM 44513]